MSDKTYETNTKEEVIITGTDETGTEDGDNTGESKSCTGATEPQNLIAVAPVLFESHQYKPGDVLPTHNLEMNKAWLDAGTAVWKAKGTAAVKARPASAQAGLTGAAHPSHEEDLMGKIPESKARGRQGK